MSLTKDKLEKRLEYAEHNLTSALITHLFSSKKTDRDRAIRAKAQVDLLKELINDKEK